MRNAARFSPEVEVELEVPFHDVDMLRIVWHGHYFKYFEIARTQLMRNKGLSAEQLVASGYTLVVIESKARYPAPLRFGQRFVVGATFADVDYRLKIDYQIYNITEDRRAAYGHTVLATLSRGGELLLRTPDLLLDRVRGPSLTP
jgi:acyl-CoA thioester hydrolase